MQAWRQHWNHQLYKALEHQYQMGLEALNKNLPEIHIDLTFKSVHTHTQTQTLAVSLSFVTLFAWAVRFSSSQYFPKNLNCLHRPVPFLSPYLLSHLTFVCLSIFLFLFLTYKDNSDKNKIELHLFLLSFLRIDKAVCSSVLLSRKCEHAISGR